MDKKTLSNLELEVTQKIQLHFPRGIIPQDVLTKWGNCPSDVLTFFLSGFFKSFPDVNKIDSIIRINYYLAFYFPNNFEQFIHSDLESKDSSQYDVSNLAVYTEIGVLKDIYLKMIENESIKDQLGYYDLLAIQSKGLNFCQSNFLPVRSIFGLKGAVKIDNHIYFPALEIHDDELVIKWYPARYNLRALEYLAKLFKHKTK